MKGEKIWKVNVNKTLKKKKCHEERNIKYETIKVTLNNFFNTMIKFYTSHKEIKWYKWYKE